MMAQRSVVVSILPFVVLAFLLSYSDSFSYAATDCQEDECFGTDMFPEKSLNPDTLDYRTVANSGAQPAVHNEAQNSGFMQVQQLDSFILKQQEQLEHLELLVEKLHHSIDKLGFEFLEPLGQRRISADEKPVITQHGATCTAEQSEKQQGASDSSLSVVTRIKDDANEEQKDAVRTADAVDSRKPVAKMPQPPWTKARGEIASAGHGYSGGMTVARYKPAWSEHFQFLSALKVDGEVTCLHVLPHEGEEGVSKYVAVGDETGRVYIFLSHGDLLVDFSTISHSPVTAMLSFPSRRNETLFLTGHSDGTVLVHKIWETTHTGPAHGDDWHALSMEYVQSLLSPGFNDDPAGEIQLSEDESRSAGKLDVTVNTVTILEIYRVGKMRYILVSDAEGKIQVFRENGTFYGVAKASSQALAFLRSPNSQRLLFLTQAGAASLDLRSMTVRSGPCEGLNGSRVVAYAFDASGRSKAYGFTAEGHMVYVALSGDTLHFECHVRSIKKLEIGGPVVPHCIKGYLLVATPTEVCVYNTTLQVGYTYTNIPVGVPRRLFASGMDEISSSFFNSPAPGNGQPVITCNRDRLVVLGFGDGFVGIYKSNLPVQKPAQFNAKVWSSPVFITLLIMLGGWHFFGKKRDSPLALNAGSPLALASSSVSTPGYVRTGLGEIMDPLMESRRYSSPSKAFPGNTSAYSSSGIKFRTPTVEQSFRTSGETKFRNSSTAEPSFRSSSVEPNPYSSRRESIFTTALPAGEKSFQ